MNRGNSIDSIAHRVSAFIAVKCAFTTYWNRYSFIVTGQWNVFCSKFLIIYSSKQMLFTYEVSWLLQNFFWTPLFFFCNRVHKWEFRKSEKTGNFKIIAILITFDYLDNFYVLKIKNCRSRSSLTHSVPWCGQFYHIWTFCSLFLM